MITSFISTVYNEEKTIEKFLDSLFRQSLLPDEIIIVDGGSEDNTINNIKNIKSKYKNFKGKFLIITKIGNRSVGRNEAIKNTTGDIIVCSDAGNILDQNWLKNITKPFENKQIDVVSGYYQGKAENIFQKCLIPYVLVMPDRVDPDNFLPATRSMAFTKSIWKKAGEFDESLSHNEDYAFAKSLKRIGVRIVFAKNAKVYWLPRKTFKEAFIMFFRFAFGDAEAKILRDTVLLLFARYFLGLYLIFLSVLYRSIWGFAIIISLFFLYIAWSIKKNLKYVSDKRAIYVLPLIQFTADIAVLSGTAAGILKRLREFNFLNYLKKNKFLFAVLLVYLAILISTISYGIPNAFHPYPYHMDEWHQLQSVGNTFRYGTPNTSGSANGTMFHFLYSGYYLIPFILTGIINPFDLHIDNLLMREKIFLVLRAQTILFGILSIFLINKIAEILKVPKKLSIILFTFSPIWILLSGYFKYDIALIFWILLSLLCYIRYGSNSNLKNYIISGIISALAVSVKISAIPLFLIYIFSFIWFNKNWKKNLNQLFIGVLIFIFCLLIFGMPDTLFGRGNIMKYFIENVIQGPPAYSNYNIGIDQILYIFTKNYPLIFGHGMLLLFILSSVLLIFKWVHFVFALRTSSSYDLKIRSMSFLLISLIILLASIIPLKLGAAGNRSLVMLPFFVFIISFLFDELKKIPVIKIPIYILLIIIFAIQIYELGLWLPSKINKSPQQTSSQWIQNNIPKNSIIGIENVPIYQNVPDIIQKEYYFEDYKIKQSKKFNYQIIDNESKNLPKYIVLTNDELINKLFIKAPQKDLVKRLEKEKYIKIKIIRSEFIENFKFYADDRDFYLSGLLANPLTITIYRRSI